MAGPFYFAYVGGQTDPAFSLITTGDIWGGSFNFGGTTWGGTFSTTGDITEGSQNITNMLRDDGLIVGEEYTITAQGLPTIDPRDGFPITVTFIYNGNLGGTLSLPSNYSTAGVGMLLVNETGRNIVFLNNTIGLVSGRSYGISGNGIPSGTTFTFTGSAQITISQNATATTKYATLKIASLEDINLLKNIASVTGLVNGQTYNVFGQGIPGGTTAVYAGGNSLTLSNNSVATFSGVTVNISKGVTYSDGGAFNPAVHLVEDERIYALELTQEEGDFASLMIEIATPTVGLLNSGRSVWCWLAWDAGGERGVVPMFHGRLIGMPENAGKETLQLRFVARPEDYQSQKIALANSLKVAPYWDSVWIAENENDPDTVLNARSALWHVDRTTLTVSVSDIIAAEDGTITIDETECSYEDFDINYAAAPLRSINITADVQWSQTGEDDVDISREIYQAFADVGSGHSYPIIGSFTGEGLKSAWPAAFAAIGGGWTMGSASQIIDASPWIKTGSYPVTYLGPDTSTQTTQENQSPTTTVTMLSLPTVPSIDKQLLTPNVSYNVLFPLYVFAIHFVLHYAVARDRSESVSFTMNADVQAVLVEPGTAEEDTLTLHSDFITAPIDPDGAVPLIDLRSNTYFKTDRGQQSFEYLLMLARARLLARARVVSVKCTTDWITLIDVSLRKNVQLTDRRLPGGTALGKVTSYKFTATPTNNDFTASVTFACTVGNGNSVTASVGTPTCIDDGYVDDGYQQEIGGQISLVSSDITYESFDDFQIYDDDGVDFFNINSSNVIINLQILGGYDEQKKAIDAAVSNNSEYGDPVTTLGATPTRVILQLQPLTGGPFNVEYSVIVSDLAVPKTIDLGANS